MTTYRYSISFVDTFKIHTDTYRYSDTCRCIPDTDLQYLYVSENEYRQIQADTEVHFPYIQICTCKFADAGEADLLDALSDMGPIPQLADTSAEEAHGSESKMLPTAFPISKHDVCCSTKLHPASEQKGKVGKQ